MKIEVLFPEICNLFGDMSNVRYLQKCLPDAEFVETPLGGTPAFLTEDVALIYLGPMTERTQEKVVDFFRPMKDRIRELMEKGTAFLFTGNALEVLGEYMENEDGTRVQGLGLLPLYAKRDMMHRHNSTFLGLFEGKEIMGFKSQFTMAYPTGELNAPFTVESGIGLHREYPAEGVRVHNFFGTYLLGPVLLLNPPFTRYLLTCMGVENPQIAFEEAAEAAWEKRLADFRSPAFRLEKEGDSNKLPIDFSPKACYNFIKRKLNRRGRTK